MRTLPVADGVLKHQIYLSANAETDLNHAIVTVWTWKAGGSPVGATRIDAERAAITAWFTSDGRGILSNQAVFRDIRTWDYGLDPATRTAPRFWPWVAGTVVPNNNFPDQSTLAPMCWVVALRTQPVGSGVRDRLNGRLAWPLAYNNPGGPIPTSNAVQAAFANLRANRLNGTGNVGTWSVVSFYTAGAERVTPLVVPVDHVLVQRLGYQRRRKLRPGPYARGA